jgi:hypothetical protein
LVYITQNNLYCIWREMELYRIHRAFFKKWALAVLQITTSSNIICHPLSLLYLILPAKSNMSYICVIIQFSVVVLAVIPTTGKTEKLMQPLYICLIIIPPLSIITYSHENESYTLNSLRSPSCSVLYTITIVNPKGNNNL